MRYAVDDTPNGDPQSCAILTTEVMTVHVRRNFLSVIAYVMADPAGRVMQGQPLDVRDVEINGVVVTLEDRDVAFTQPSADEAQYVLDVRDSAGNVNASLTVAITVRDNMLWFEVVEVSNNLDDERFPVQTISFPNQSLVSVRSDQCGAALAGAVMSCDTNKTGDEYLKVTDKLELADRDYMYAFISADSLGAGLWSNSEHDGRSVAISAAGGSQNTRVLVTTQSIRGITSLGLASAPWYYHRKVIDSRGRSYIVEQTAMPKAAVAIAGDLNGDGNVDWQDAAIAFRGIMNNPTKSEDVPELVSWRIVMNFGSQVQNPFLATLDNVKKVFLGTDGLGQSVMLKGYGNEGHDSGHPDYDDIGWRMGGERDFRTLLRQGRWYGARFGVHINASELYPESRAIDERMVRRDADGRLFYGWNWIDQSIGIDGIYDLASGNRERRLRALKDKVGDDLDFVYLDVWGNRASSPTEDSWETRKMSKMINDNGWRMATEYGSGNEYDATMQHWAVDLGYNYSGSTGKGENSQIMRFLRNHQKDSWVGDYPSYGGAANAPLLGGYDLKDFEGWQGHNDYDAFIINLFTHNLSTKFIQHFTVRRWVNNPLDNAAPRDPAVNGGNEWIRLENEAGDILEISRASNDSSDERYRSRTLTLNGRVVSFGETSRGDGLSQGDESYLLPWLWNTQDGGRVGPCDERLFHWNTRGGTTEWVLPDGWRDQSEIAVYELTDVGRIDVGRVLVRDGMVSLSADAQTPYVVYRGDSLPEPISMEWSVDSHLADVGFNGGESGLLRRWSIDGEGKASIEKSVSHNPMLALSGDIVVSQHLTDMRPGARYALYVGVDNRSDGDASMSVMRDGVRLAENTAPHSIAKNYVQSYAHNTNSATVGTDSYFQNMYVFFSVPEQGGEMSLVLSHQGDGCAYFDDIRVVENEYNGLSVAEDGSVLRLSNDFERNAQGIWPFVIAGAEGVEDNRIHLSEMHVPYTQAGWDAKRMDDVIAGRWSVKIDGLTERDALVYRTIPQNVRFSPGVSYRVSFDYQSGSAGTYAVAIGSDEDDGSVSSMRFIELDESLGRTSRCEFVLVGDAGGDSWFGIYSTSRKADTQGTDGDEANFGGYRDLVLDNLEIERIG